MRVKVRAGVMAGRGRGWISAETGCAGQAKNRIGEKIKLTASDQDLVGAVLVTQLGSIALPGLELDGDLLLVEQVRALEDDTKAALANLLADAIMHAHDVGRGASARHCCYLEEVGGRGS